MQINCTLAAFGLVWMSCRSFANPNYKTHCQSTVAMHVLLVKFSTAEYLMLTSLRAILALLLINSLEHIVIITPARGTGLGEPLRPWPEQYLVSKLKEIV